MRRWELFDAPLEGPTLIEASAGTGKTYTITGLYLRLVVEMDLPVASILVMTFTNAATAELRERILGRLVECREALEEGGDDEVVKALVAACGEAERVRLRIQRAILEFDQAAVYTIHGFCQRVLADSAFRGALPFEMALASEQTERLQRAVDDYWAMHIQDRSPLFIDWLLDKGVSADSLFADLAQWLGRPGLEVIAAPMPSGLEEAEQEFRVAFREASGQWAEQREEIADLLRHDKALNGTKYRKASLENWFAALDDYLGAEPGAWFKEFGKFARATIETSVKKNEVPPEHPFFDACQRLLDARERLHGLYRQALSAHRAALMTFVRDQLHEEKGRERVRTFDDLIGDLHQALHGARGERLAALLRSRYRAALVDEFQDTDPLQYGIFSRIYGGHPAPLFLVGDPKQAIYSFRGADVFAYLRAKGETARQYTLVENWRSVDSLVEAVNQLFEGHEAPFIDGRIEFVPVTAASRRSLAPLLEGDDPSVFRFRFLEADDKPLNVEDAKQRAAADAAREIARLLQCAADGCAHIGDEKLEAGHIAVLVRNARQGEAMQQALREVGVNSVLRSRESVFHSTEAEMLERLLLALLEPGRSDLVRAALATPLFGYEGGRLGPLDGVEESLDEVMGDVLDYHQLWREHGFARMFRHLMLREGVAGRLLGRVGGERSLTNLSHLAELLHAEERERSPGMEGLAKWLAGQRSMPRPQDDESMLRLESDANLVQIVTIHSSKGLEYPVVFCPFLWYANSKRWVAKSAPVFLFHTTEEAERIALETGSPEAEIHWQQALREQLAEDVRLLYVALTRAKCRCYCTWGNVKSACYTGLGWLLHPPASRHDDVLVTSMRDAFKSLDNTAMRAVLERLAEENEVISVSTVGHEGEEIRLQQQTPTGRRLEARRFSVIIPPPQRLTSFSALATHLHALEDADYDAAGDEGVDSLAIAEGHSVDSFPRGARAGSCLHRIFERLDFSAAVPGELDVVVSEALARYGFDMAWVPFVSEWTRRVLETPLDGTGLRLCDIGLERRLTELEFHYPIERLVSVELRELLVEHGFAPEGPLSAALQRLDFKPVSGFMHGYIDLVFEADGRFHVLDYKSNWLGVGREPYAAAQLGDVIARDSYYLQYLFYALAVHRYLRSRIPGYRYEQHFGGVYYLFLRGMDPVWGHEYGVYRDRIPEAIIDALDRYLEGDDG